jgi:hypothetical protein
MSTQSYEESFTSKPILPIDKPDIDTLVGEGGAFNKMLDSVACVMGTEFRKGRIKAPDYSKVLSEAISETLKNATDFTIQRELVAAQAEFYKWQSYKFKQDSILVTSKEIESKAKVANEVLTGCLTKEKIVTEQKNQNLIDCKVLECEANTALLDAKKTNTEANTSVQLQQRLKLIEDTAVSHNMIEQTAKKTLGIMAETDFTKEQTKHEIQKKLETIEKVKLVTAQTSHEGIKELQTLQQTSFITKQTAHEVSKKLNTEADTGLTLNQASHELSKKLDTEAHTSWMVKHALVEHELIAYTKARAGLELKRIQTEQQKIELMYAQTALERAKLPLICAQIKVELRRVDSMAYDAVLKKVEVAVRIKEISLKGIEVKLLCARANSENYKSLLTKYQAMGILEQAKTEQANRSLMLANAVKAQAEIKAVVAQAATAKQNSILIAHKVETEVAQSKVLLAKLGIFKAQISAFRNDTLLRRAKMIDDVSIAVATLGDGNVTGLVSKGNDLVLDEADATFDQPDTVDTSSIDDELTDSDTQLQSLIDGITDPELPDGDVADNVDCDVEDDSGDYTVASLPVSDINCGDENIVITAPVV